MGFLPPKTASGACTYDSLSALQKYIRRSMTHEAILTAFDLAPRHMAVLRNRLRIISHEDIGIACPAASVAAWDWGDELWGHWRGGAPGWKPLLARIVQVLCSAGKSRLADHAGRIGQDRAEFGPYPALASWDTPEAAQALLRDGTEEDFITAVFGIRRSRGLRYAQDALVDLATTSDRLSDPWARQVLGHWRKHAMAWGADGPWCLVLANSAVYLYRNAQFRAETAAWSAENAVTNRSVPPVPDFALDMHTRRGRALGRGLDHFRAVGAHLVPAPTVEDPYVDEAYRGFARLRAERPAKASAKPMQAPLFDLSILPTERAG